MRQPWLRLWVGDWRQCPELRLCSLAARGLWVDLLCRAHQSEPYGHIVYESIEEIALDVGRPTAEVQSAFEELERRHVFSRISDGLSGTPPTIASRRMVRDEQRRVQNQKNGTRGGNPALLEAEDGGRITDGISAKSSDAGYRSEARGQKPEVKNPPHPPSGGRSAQAPTDWRAILRETPSLDTEPVVTAIDRWVGYRRKRRLKPWVEDTWRSQFREAVEWGPDGLVAAVEHTIRKGWQGLQPAGPTNGHVNGESHGHKPRPAKTAAYMVYGSAEWQKVNGQVVS